MKLLKRIKYPLTIFLLISIVCGVFFLHKKLKGNEYAEVIKEDIIEPIAPVKEETSEEKICTVDIKGAIQKPGVYQVDCDKKVNDVIVLAGGLLDSANTSVINLAKKIDDEMVIVVYTNDEVKNSNVIDTVVKVIEKECHCPNIKNDGCINDKIDSTITNKPNDKDTNSNNKIDLNKATLEELMDIPKIGESKAKAILEYREKNNGFKDTEELLDVSGIGDKLYEEIKVYFK